MYGRCARQGLKVMPCFVTISQMSKYVKYIKTMKPKSLKSTLN